MNKETAIVIFKEKSIRRTWHNDEWWFSVVDICAVLTESLDAGAYWRKLKQRLLREGSQVVTNYHELDNSEPVTNCHGLKIQAQDGKWRITDCANTEGILRIAQSIPSPKAEPFKRWLAKVGYERIQEIENPALAQERMKKLYEQKGYPKDWIDKRIRGITEQTDYAILTAEISNATFGMTPSEYKQHKNLPKRSKTNLRDHMTDLELIFTMLGEKVTTEISHQEKPEGMPANKKVARRGGKVSGNARKETEKELGKSIISPDNHLNLLESNINDEEIS
ncbi:MAG: Bro-N domain-containing protein [Coxiellaceae bacterium]|nr:Bro-N domain-containing protein [Coxiellaceae bacterium]